MNIFDLQATISLNGDAFMNGVQQAQTAFGGLGNTVSAGAVALGNLASGAITKAADGIVDFGKAALDTGMSFDQSMANVAAISGATAEDVENLRDKAKEMGATTKFTASQAADAFSYMAMAGWDAGQMMDGITGIMNLAAASGEDLATTSDIVTDALTAFGLKAEDSGHFADVLAAASSNANTNVGLMGETFKYAAPVAGALGFTIEDTAQAIGLMANAGIKGSQAGTALRSILSRLAKPTKESETAMNMLGVTIDNADGSMKSFGEIMDDIRRGFEGNLKISTEEYTQKVAELNAQFDDKKISKTDYQAALELLDTRLNGSSESVQAMAAAMLGGQEAMSGLLAIVNSSAEDYAKLSGAIEGASGSMGDLGAAAKMAETQLDNLPGSITLMQSAFDGFKTAIYEKFSGPLKEAVDAAAGIFSDLTTIVDEKGITQAFESISGILESRLSPLFDELTEKIPGFGEAFETLSSIVSGLGEVFQPFVDAVTGAFSEAMPVVTGAVKEFLEAFQNSGAGGVIDSIAAGARDLLSAFGTVAADAVEMIAGGISTFLSAFDNSGAADVIGTIASGAGDLLSAFGGATVDVVEGIASAVSSFMDAFDDETVAEIISPIAAGAKDLFGAFGSVAADIISNVGKNVGEFLDLFAESSVPDIIADIATHAGELLGHLQSAGAKVIEGVGNAVSGFLDAFNKDAAISLMEDVAGFIADLFAPFTDALGPAIEAAADGFKKLAEKFGEFAGELGNEIISKIRELVDEFDKWGPLVAGVAAGFGTMMIVTSLAAGIKALKAAMESGALAAKALEIAQAALNVVLNANPIGIVVGVLAGLAAAFITAYQTNDEFREKVDETFQKVKEAFEAIGQWLSEFFTSTIPDAFNKVVGWFKELPGKFMEIGADIVNGIKNGFTQAWESFKESVANLANGIVDSVKGLFGIHSPSMVFASIGENMVLGLEKGWGAEFGGLESQVDRDMRALTGTARIGFEDSAIGRSSAAGISSMFALNEGGRRGDPVSINLVLDGDVAATALYDPLRRTAFQKGQNMEAAYA